MGEDIHKRNVFLVGNDTCKRFRLVKAVFPYAFRLSRCKCDIIICNIPEKRSKLLSQERLKRFEISAFQRKYDSLGKRIIVSKEVHCPCDFMFELFGQA